jgi:hypothetical protein
LLESISSKYGVIFVAFLEARGSSDIFEFEFEYGYESEPKSESESELK